MGRSLSELPELLEMIKPNCLILQNGKPAQRGIRTPPWSHSRFELVLDLNPSPYSPVSALGV